jgi:hypothetical protein
MGCLSITTLALNQDRTLLLNQSAVIIYSHGLLTERLSELCGYAN